MVRAGYFSKMPAEIQYIVPNGMQYYVQQVRTKIKINLEVVGTYDNYLIENDKKGAQKIQNSNNYI